MLNSPQVTPIAAISGIGSVPGRSFSPHTAVVKWKQAVTLFTKIAFHPSGPWILWPPRWLNLLKFWRRKRFSESLNGVRGRLHIAVLRLYGRKISATSIIMPVSLLTYTDTRIVFSSTFSSTSLLLWIVPSFTGHNIDNIKAPLSSSFLLIP